MKSKKGFTLIEILVTISIMIVIVVIAVPVTTSILDNNKEKQYNEYVKQFESAAKSYVSDNKNIIDVLKNDTNMFYIVTLSDLQQDNYISEIPKNPITNQKFDETTPIKISYSGDKIIYEYKTTSADTIEKTIGFDSSIDNSYDFNQRIDLLSGVYVVGETGVVECSGLTCGFSVTVDGALTTNYNTILNPGNHTVVYTKDALTSGNRTIVVAPDPNDITTIAISSSMPLYYEAGHTVNPLPYLTATKRNGQVATVTLGTNVTCTPTASTINTTIDYKCSSVSRSDGGTTNSGTKTLFFSNNLSTLILYQYDHISTTNMSNLASGYWYLDAATHNYATYRGKTWRIMNRTINGRIKMILDGTTAGLIPYDESNCCDDGSCNNVSVHGTNFYYNATYGLNPFYNSIANASTVNQIYYDSWIYGWDGVTADTSYIGGLTKSDFDKVTNNATTTSGYLKLTSYYYWMISTYPANYSYGYTNKYVVNTDGSLASTAANGSAYVRPVIVLNSCVTVSNSNNNGNPGTSTNPYAISGGC